MVYFQMSQIGNWIVSTDFDGFDIKLEQVSPHRDPATLGLYWKKTIHGPRVVGTNLDSGRCNWYKKSGTSNGAVYFEDHTSTTKPICNSIHCETIEGTPRYIQEEGKAEMCDYSPITTR